MKTTKLLILTCALSLNSVFAQENKANDNTHTVDKSYLELPSIEVIPIKDSQADRQYELYIKLPEEYSENKDKKYPVLYYTDAMWHVEVLSGSAAFIMEEVILVGISWEKDLKGELGALGAHASRFRDYSIQPSSNPENQAKYQLGQASNHLDFIRNDVIKYIENNYRTDPEKRAYFGYSMGGKFGVYILLTEPSTFKNYILGSPSLSRGRDVPILSELGANEALNAKDLNANVFISYGDLERESSPYTDEIIAMLKNKNDERLSLKHIVIEGNHETAFPMTAVRSMHWLSDINNFPVLEGPYFGQKPPGLIPELFAPGIVSTEEHLETVVTFLPDMSELSFTRSGGKYKEPTLFVMQYKNNRWSRKFVLPTDEKKYEERFNPALSEMKRNEAFKDIPITGFTVSAKGTYYFYFIDFERGGNGHMSYSRLIDGKYETPQKLSKAINTGKYIAHPFIAPDESYLMWDAEIEGESTPDVYISFRQKDGSWGTAINMGDKINTAAYEQRLRVTPDGKYLFFWRGDKKVREDGSTYWVGNPYWVDAQIIETLRPK